MTDVQGAIALVTGGQRGLGKAFTQQLLDNGAAKVYVTARDPQPATDPRIVALPLEVTDPHSVTVLAKAAPDITIVINNAGVAGSGPLLAADLDEVQQLFDINVFGPLRIAQAFAPILARNGGGALVDVHSALSWIAGAGAYGASKAAFWSLTNSLRLELAEQGTQVVGVHLGYTDTDMVRNVDAPKNDPLDVAREVITALRDGSSEVLADDVSRHFKSVLSGSVEGLRL